MPANGSATRWSRFSPVLLLGLLSCHDCSDPWPEPAPSAVQYLTVLPGALEIHIADATRSQAANLLAFVQDKYGRNLGDRSTRFAVATGGPALSLTPLGAHPDSVTLTVAAACDTPTPCAPAPIDGVVTATHDGSGLTLQIPIRVRYDAGGVHGVAAVPTNAWPMIGLASGRVAGVWQSRMMRAFIGRAGFVKFDAGVITLPETDDPAGTVLSHSYAAWRQPQAWGDAVTTVMVPPTVVRSGIRIKARYAADPSQFAANELGFLVGLQAGADIISYTPIGALVSLEGTITQVPPVTWAGDCAVFGNEVQAKLAQGDQPEKDVISVYMVSFSTSTAATTRAAHCGPGTLGSTAAFAEAHVIVVPQGSAPAATLAHELGHVLSLEHVSFGSGFFDDNLMVITDDLSAPMRSRLTVGQAWRAAFHEPSYIVTAGQAKSAPLHCLDMPQKCPGIADDVRGRTP